MNEKKQGKIFNDFPQMFRGRTMKSGSILPISFGLECDNGWYQLIYNLCRDIQKVLDNTPEQNLADSFIIDQVKEKFGCYDSETELLTKDGWKYFKDLTFKDEILTKNSTGELCYEYPLDIVSYQYSGRMYRLKTKMVDLLTTPNHQLWVAKGTYWNGRYQPPLKREFPFEFTLPSKYFGLNKCFERSGVWLGKNIQCFSLPVYSFKVRNKLCGSFVKRKLEKKIPMRSWLDFLGWYLAEGHAERSQISLAYNYKSIKEKGEIRNSIQSIGFKPHDTEETFNIYSIQLASWLSRNCGARATEKKVPDFVKQLNPGLIRILLSSLFKGDGYRAKTSEHLYTVSKKLSDDVQELILKVGYSANISQYPPRRRWYRDHEIIEKKSFAISWLKNSNFHNTQEKGLAVSSEESWTNYNGPVYCVTVSSHLLYVRRHGIPVWCGNSLRFYASGFNEEIDNLIRKAETESATTCEICGKPGDLSVSSGWYKTLCSKCRKKEGYLKCKKRG